MGVTIRSVANPAELEKVFELLETNHPDISKEKFAAQIQHESKYESWQTRVAEENGQIVAALQIFDRQMWLKGKPVPFAGLGNLAVHPEYRNHFNSAELIKDTLDLLSEFDYPLSVVLSRDNSFYERFGFVTMPLIEFSFEKFEVSDVVGVRPFDRAKDLERVMAMHTEFNKDRSGPVCRTAANWEAQLNRQNEVFYVIEREGAVNGYLRGEIKNGVLEILEFCGVKSYAALFRRIMYIVFNEHDFYTAKISLRREEPFFNASYVPARQKHDTRLMWSVLNESKLADMLGIEPSGVQTFIKQLRDFQITFWFADAF
jgi:predicted acetyltransferase